jgi:hypothetical protein
MSKLATKKGTSVSTELTMGQAGVAVKKALSEITVAIEKLQSLEEKSDSLSLQIANKEAQIDELSIAYQEKQRQAELDLSLRMKEQTQTVVREYLTASQQTAISTTELAQLRKDYETLKMDFTKEVSAQVSKAEGIAKNSYNQELKLKEAEFLAKEASNNAEIKNLQKEAAFLKEQVEMWKQQLDSEREASISRAKASQVGSINVGTPTNGR